MIGLLGLTPIAEARGGSHVRKEVVEAKVGEPHDATPRLVEEDVVVLAPQEDAPLGVVVETGDAYEVDTVQDYEVTTWNRRDWRWKLSPKGHTLTAAGMLGGGLVAILAAAAAEGDTEEERNGKALLAVGGAVAIVGAPVPLVVLGVRKAQTVDTVDSRVEESRVLETSPLLRNAAAFDGSVGVTVVTWSAGEVAGEIPFEQGRAQLGSATVPYIYGQRYAIYEVRGANGAVDRKLSNAYQAQWQGLHERYQTDLLANPEINASFSHSYRTWQEEQARLAAEARASHEAWLEQERQEAASYSTRTAYRYDYSALTGVSPALGKNGDFGSRFLMASASCGAEAGVEVVLDGACVAALTLFRIPVPPSAVCGAAAAYVGNKILAADWDYWDTLNLGLAVLDSSDAMRDSIGPPPVVGKGVALAGFAKCIYDRM